MIYFIRDTTSDLIKIGYSAAPWARFSKVQSDCSATLEMLGLIEGDVAAEQALHTKFAAHRIRGEWFRHECALAAFIAALGPPPSPERKKKGKAEAFWNGTSSAELAAKSGLSVAQVTRIQTGKSRPTPETAIKLQRLTGVSAIGLVFGELASEAA